MSVVDSEAVFLSRAKAVGVTDAVITVLKNAGFDTMGKMACSSAYVPGSSDEAPFLEVIKKALAREPSLIELATLRRLLNESYAASTVEMKTMVEQTEGAPVRKLQPAERAERYREQQRRLSGLQIRGHLDPGDSLIDKAVTIYEADRLQYLEWQVCVSREHELLTSSKKDTALSFDGSGSLKLSKSEGVEPCGVTSDL